MNRRRYLVALGTASSTLAGCAFPGRPASSTLTATESNAPDSATPASTTRNGSAPRSCPPPANAFVPDDPSGAVTTLCGEAASTGDVRLTASVSTLSSSGDELLATLHNDGEVPVHGGRFSVTLYYWFDGEWKRIFRDRRRPPGEGVTITPGGTRRFRIEASADLDPVSPPPTWLTSEGRVFRLRLPPGDYAFGYEVREGGPGGETDASTTETADRTRYARRFGVEGDLPLVPSAASTDAVRDGDTLVVRTHDAGDDARVSLILDRLPSVPDGSARVSTFTLYNPHVTLLGPDRGTPRPVFWYTGELRDGLAHADGSAARVRIETRIASEPVLAEPLSIIHDGTPWRITAETGWGSG